MVQLKATLPADPGLEDSVKFGGVQCSGRLGVTFAPSDWLRCIYGEQKFH